MNLVEELKLHVDSVGLVQPTWPVEGRWASGNGLLYTAYALVVFGDEIDEELKARFRRAYETCQLYPGLLIRHPLNLDQEGPDDYIGAAAASYLLSTDLSSKILLRGKRFPGNWAGYRLPYYYANEGQSAFDIRAWMFRFPGVLAHIRMSAGETPCPFALLWLALTLAFQPWKSEDEPALSWLILRTTGQQSFLCKLAGSWFYRRLFKKYPGGMKDVFTRMFTEAHPIAKRAEAR